MNKTVASIFIAGIAAVTLVSTVTLIDGRVYGDEPQKIEKEVVHVTPYAAKYGYSGEPFNLSPDLPVYEPKPVFQISGVIQPDAKKFNFSGEPYNLSPDVPQYDPNYDGPTEVGTVVPYAAQYGYSGEPFNPQYTTPGGDSANGAVRYGYTGEPFNLTPDLPVYEPRPVFQISGVIQPDAKKFNFSGEPYNLSPDVPQYDVR